MKNIKTLFLLFFLTVYLFPFTQHSLIAQSKKARERKEKNYDISNYRGFTTYLKQDKLYSAWGGSLGAMNYVGDLSPRQTFGSTDLSFARPCLGISHTKKLGSHIFIRNVISYGTIAGDDSETASQADDLSKYRYVRNLHFRNRIAEFSMVGIYELIPHRGNLFRRPMFSPYLLAGVAIFYHNPQAKTPLDNLSQGGEWIALQPIGTEGQGKSGYSKKYSKFQPAIPAGIGIKYKMSNYLDLSFEISYHFTFTDYLDDVGGNYPALNDLEGIALDMTDRSREDVSAYTGKLRSMFLADEIAPNGYAEQNNIVDKRGGGIKDKFIVTGVHLTYIINPMKRNKRK